jgi:hypothetical protein
VDAFKQAHSIALDAARTNENLTKVKHIADSSILPVGTADTRSVPLGKVESHQHHQGRFRYLH